MKDKYKYQYNYWQSYKIVDDRFPYKLVDTIKILVPYENTKDGIYLLESKKNKYIGVPFGNSATKEDDLGKSLFPSVDTYKVTRLITPR